MIDIVGVNFCPMQKVLFQVYVNASRSYNTNWHVHVGFTIYNTNQHVHVGF